MAILRYIKASITRSMSTAFMALGHDLLTHLDTKSPLQIKNKQISTASGFTDIFAAHAKEMGTFIYTVNK